MNKEKIKDTFELQNKLNLIVNKNWTEDISEKQWCLAISQESSELIDHVGWKWWKDLSKPMDLYQAKLEVVDIYHFIVSLALVNIKNNNDNGIESAFLLNNFVNEFVFPEFEEKEVNRERILESAIKLQLHVISHNNTPESLINIIKSFGKLRAEIGLSIEELYKIYITKNALNIFRQENGYKDGTYRKTWHDGQEDNVHLEKITNNLGNNLNFEAIFEELNKEYSK